jgi:uncharacterized protein
MRRFWILLFVVTAVAQVPFAVALDFTLRRAGVPGSAIVAAAAAACATFALRGRVRKARDDRRIPPLQLVLLEEPYYAHWGATILALPLFALALAVALAATILGLPAPPPGQLAVAVYGFSLAVSCWGVFVRRRLVRVRTIEVPIAGLPAAFDGYRIVQLSDLHIGGLWPRSRAEGWVRRANRLDADLVALTGDYVTSGTAFHEDIAAVLSSFRARDGAFAVMGNHDYFGDGEPLVTLLRAGGVSVLRNERRTLSRGEATLTLAGVDDTWTKRANVARTMEGCDRGAPVIVLAHDPKLFPDLASRGASLVLSGHTHWGQIAVPFFPTRFNLSSLSYRYHAGVYTEGDATLYVHPGLGTTGPPIRLGAPPEITILRLRRVPHGGAGGAGSPVPPAGR